MQTSQWEKDQDLRPCGIVNIT